MCRSSLAPRALARSHTLAALCQILGNFILRSGFVAVSTENLSEVE